MQWAAMPLVRVGLTRGGHVALNLGMEFPLSDQSWDHRIYATLLWDFADVSIFAGWQSAVAVAPHAALLPGPGIRPSALVCRPVRPGLSVRHSSKLMDPKSANCR